MKCINCNLTSSDGGRCLKCIAEATANYDLDSMDRDEMILLISHMKNIIHQLELVIENSADTLFVTDGEGNIMLVNRAWEELSHAKREEVLGHNIRELLGEVISESSTIAALRSKHTSTVEQKLLRAENMSYTTSVPVYIDGEIGMVVSNNRNIYDIERMSAMQHRLEEAEKKASVYRERMERIQDELLDSGEIIAEDVLSLNTIYRANKVAKTDSSVLITGETGSGKEVFAKYIHGESERAGQPFISVNCGALLPSIAESELFGYEKGSFTGANTAGKKGLFEVANNGTIFLDEVGELSQDLQVKLLRVIQEQEILPVGATNPVKINVRIISATNRDIKDMMKMGRFRPDLYYRLSTVTLEIPPLRKRINDILPLTHHFIKEFNQKYGTDKYLTPGAFRMLKEYSFPGNIRELKNCLEEAMVMCEGDKVHRSDFQIAVYEEDYNLSSNVGEKGITEILEDIERKHLIYAMEHYGSVRKAAEALKLAPTTFARRYKQIVGNEHNES